MSAACLEIVWLHGLLLKLEFPQIKPTSLYVDNTSVIQIVANPIFHKHTNQYMMPMMIKLYNFLT